MPLSLTEKEKNVKKPQNDFIYRDMEEKLKSVMGTKVTMKKYISTEQGNNEKVEEQSKLKEGI